MKDIKWIDFLKLRATAGILCSDEVSEVTTIMIIHTHNMVALHGMRTIIQTNWYTQKKVVILISDMKKKRV